MHTYLGKQIPICSINATSLVLNQNGQVLQGGQSTSLVIRAHLLSCNGKGIRMEISVKTLLNRATNCLDVVFLWSITLRINPFSYCFFEAANPISGIYFMASHHVCPHDDRHCRRAFRLSLDRCAACAAEFECIMTSSRTGGQLTSRHIIQGTTRKTTTVLEYH